LSLDDVRAIRAATACELEMFVHGALCVSYSGQCFSSEAWGGRSANRGQCAQACRLPYDLIVDDMRQPLGDARYLLSPGDLYALRQMPEIVRIGVHALKIEGRYKDADYVALTTAAYRQAVDEAWAGLPLSITPQAELQLEQVYSRGLGAHFVTGTNHQTVVAGRSPRHRGVLIGRVSRVLADRVWITPEAATAALAPLKPGDGVVFDAADWRSPEEREEGGRVYHVTAPRHGALEVTFGNGAIDFGRIRPGDLLWRSHDPDLDKAARPYLDAAAPVHRQPVAVYVTAVEGAPLVTAWTLAAHPEVQVTLWSDERLGTATQRAVDAAYLREQLGRLGGTPYVLGELTAEISGRPFAPSSLLNHLRRQAVAQLQTQQAARTLIVSEPLAALQEMLETGRQGEGEMLSLQSPISNLSPPLHHPRTPHRSHHPRRADHHHPALQLLRAGLARRPQQPTRAQLSARAARGCACGEARLCAQDRHERHERRRAGVGLPDRRLRAGRQQPRPHAARASAP